MAPLSVKSLSHCFMALGLPSHLKTCCSFFTTPVSRPIRALGILNVDAGIYAADARAALFVVQELLLFLQSTKTPCTDSLVNSLFHAKFSEIDSENTVLVKNTRIIDAAMFLMTSLGGERSEGALSDSLGHYSYCILSM